MKNQPPPPPPGKRINAEDHTLFDVVDTI